MTETKPHTTRSRVAYFLFSLLLAWHALALLVGPAPGSHTMGKIYPVFEPYLRFFHLENYWAFFAPDPASGNLLRYLVVDGEGKEHVFKLTETHHRHEAAYFRHTTFYTAISEQKDLNYTTSFAHWLCRRHAPITPRHVQFFTGQQQRLPRAEYLKGKRPLDEEYTSVRYEAAIPCPTGLTP
jgi:hypothetical protein